MAVTGQGANLCHFVVTVKHSVQYSSSGRGGSISIL